MTEYGLLKVLAKIAEKELQGAKYICQNTDGNWFTSIEKPYFNETWSASQHIAESEYMGTPTVYEIHAILNKLYIESSTSGACYRYSSEQKTVLFKKTYFPGKTQGTL